MDVVKKLSLAVLFVCAMLLAGCEQLDPAAIQAWTKPYETNVTADRYVVQPPDELELRCAQVPEINMQKQRVRPDGKISFEVLGDFEVAGSSETLTSPNIFESAASSVSSIAIRFS